ncbi:MAG: hypothetical protein ABI995_06530 [Acidobacteriota bacterium]
MSCCGRNRGAVQGVSGNPRMQASQSGAYDSGVTFEYIGSTGLTAIGQVTRRTYVFSEPGVRITADRRDAMSLLAIPVLRQIR